jgi:thiazolinyl imide reductase
MLYASKIAKSWVNQGYFFPFLSALFSLKRRIARLKSNHKFKVLVCGSRWGRLYFDALSARRRKKFDFQLIGILARGSTNSQALAKEFRLPLFRSVSELPENIADIAIVAIGGDDGDSIALHLLDRKIPVLCEHPRTTQFLKKAIRCSESSNSLFHVHGHFTETPSAKIFLQACAKAGGANSAVFLSALGNPRTLYSLVDLLSHAFGDLEPWSLKGLTFTGASNRRAFEKVTFQIVHGRIAGVPSVFQSQSRIMTEDNGWEPVSHHLTIGFPTGNLTMLESFGPVIWTYRSARSMIKGLKEKDRMSFPLVNALDFLSWRKTRIEILRRGVEKLCQEMITGKRSPNQRIERLMQVSKVWQDLAIRLHGKYSS